jgi:hypothetical protein
MVAQVKISTAIAVSLLVLTPALPADAQDLAEEILELQRTLAAMKSDYESRIQDLEDRVTRAEQLARRAGRDADEAFDVAEQTAIDQSAGSFAVNVFNPAIGAVLIGRLADVGNGWEDIPGFFPAGETGTGDSGFALGEAELNLNAIIDSYFFGNMTLAVENDGGDTEIALEEAWFQTTGLPYGVSLTAGRFFSDVGYLNRFHRHADDFVDRPLPYQAFFGGQYVADGLQARWVLPAPLFVEVGAEFNWGGAYPVTANADTSPGAVTVFSNFGGDVGISNSWQLGVSWLSADVDGRPGGVPGNTFTGNSELLTVDFVWKWAPEGNQTLTNVKLQAEFFDRSEDGEFAGLAYAGEQSGWYLQGVWQFAQRWRAGYRHDAVDAGNGSSLAGTMPEGTGRRSDRDSVMLDWSPSEFSRLRVQVVQDRVLPETDTQWFLQYIMSIGAHGAHEF